MKRKYVSMVMCLFVFSLFISGCGTPKSMAEYQKSFNAEIQKQASKNNYPPADSVIKTLEYNGLSYVAEVGMTERTNYNSYVVSVNESPDQLIVVFQVLRGTSMDWWGMVFFSAINAVGQSPNQVAKELGILQNGNYKFGGMYAKSCRIKNVDYELFGDETNITLIQTINKNQ